MHTPTLETSTYAKVTARLLPFLFISYVAAYLDRVNVGFAKLQMLNDLQFSETVYGLGAGVFFIGYFLFEVPSNIIMHKVGARVWIGRIMITWAILSASMVFVSSPTVFYVLRFFLGVAEAGFFPGIVLYLTYWFPPRRRASVMSIFFAGVMVAGVLGGLLSGWIMRDMAGILGMKGWQWMFVIEGAPALVLAVVGHFWLQDYPRDVPWLSTAEKARLAADLGEGSTTAAGGHASAAGLRNPRVYVFALVYFAMTAATLTLNFWMPLMIRDFGVSDVVQVSLYTVIPNAIGAVGLLFIARRADRRASHPRYFALCATGGAIALAALTTHPASLVAALALLSAATVLLFAALPIFWAIPTTYLSAEARASGIAVISSVGITSGIVSPWAIGRIKTATGSMDDALYILSGLIVLSVFVLLAAVRKRAQETAA